MGYIIEVETKRRLNVPIEILRGRLLSHSYVLANEEQEIDTYYSRSDVDFMETVECLRVRVTPAKTEITYKPPTLEKAALDGSGVTAKPETNVLLANADQAPYAYQLFAALDFRELAVVDKYRESYKHPDSAYEGVTISIDTIKGVGVYVEVEVLSDDEADARRCINRVEAELSLNNMPIVTKPYRDLVMEG